MSLATLTLASDHDWVGVWLGSTLGMVLADGLAIAIGTWLHQRLPTRLLHVLASLLFLVFGLWILFDSALGWRSVALVVIAVAAAVALPAASAVVTWGSQTSRRRRTRPQATNRRRTSSELPMAPAAPGVCTRTDVCVGRCTRTGPVPVGPRDPVQQRERSANPRRSLRCP